MWKRFEKNHSISRKEAEDLAQVLNVYPGKIFHWFKHQRRAGGLCGVENTVEGRHFLTIFNSELSSLLHRTIKMRPGTTIYIWAATKVRNFGTFEGL